MPINYPQPNWIRPADPAANYGKGFGLGLQAGQAQAQINMERARLAEAQNRTQVEIALRQQELQRQSMIEQQKLEVDKAYKAQQFSLATEELGIKQQEMQQKIKEAAQRTMAMERFRNAIANQVNPVEATMQHLAGIPEYNALAASALREGNEVQKAQSPLGKLEADRAAAEKAGASPGLLQLYELNKANEVAGKGMSFRSTPGGGFEFYQGVNATTSMQTQGQEKLTQYENAIEAMTSLQKQLAPGDVGVRGKVGEVVVDEALEQLIPGVAVGDRIDARTAIKGLRATLLNVLTDDVGGRSSAAERKEVAAALPDTGMIESYASAMGKISALKGMLAKRGQVYSRNIGQERPPLWSLSPDEIKALNASKAISQEEALSALRRFHNFK